MTQLPIRLHCELFWQYSVYPESGTCALHVGAGAEDDVVVAGVVEGV